MNRHLLRRVVMHNAGSSPLCFETCAVILSAPGDWYVFRKVMEFKTLSVVKKHGGLGGGVSSDMSNMLHLIVTFPTRQSVLREAGVENVGCAQIFKGQIYLKHPVKRIDILSRTRERSDTS